MFNIPMYQYGQMEHTLQTYSSTATIVTNSFCSVAPENPEEHKRADTGTNLSAGTCLAEQNSIKRLSNLSTVLSSYAHNGLPLSVFMALEKVGKKLGVI